MLFLPTWGFSAMTTRLLEVVGVGFGYGGAQTLRGTSLALTNGGMVCLIGANGAGKTTMLRLISGLARPDSGEIRFEGRNIAGLPPQKILDLGISQVPQEGRVFADMTVYENLLMGAYRRTDKPGVREDLEMVYLYFPRLRERVKQRGGSLSGGERQMLAIARSLMARPSVLMMDEPSSGLAPMIVESLGNIICKMNKDGLSILLVEQNADLALRISHYGYVLERGTVVLEGDAKTLLDNPIVKEAYLGM